MQQEDLAKDSRQVREMLDILPALLIQVMTQALLAKNMFREALLAILGLQTLHLITMPEVEAPVISAAAEILVIQEPPSTPDMKPVVFRLGLFLTQEGLNIPQETLIPVMRQEILIKDIDQEI